MSGWIECATPGCPGDMRYAAPGRGHIPGCTAPVTASDARPPSDTGTTGWHLHPWGSAHKDDEPCTAGESRPVLVVDPVEARETIARAIATHAWDSNPNTAHGRHRFHAFCEVCAGNVEAIADLAIAALAGQGQP